jgi:hypothetical protein
MLVYFKRPWSGAIPPLPAARSTRPATREKRLDRAKEPRRIFDTEKGPNPRMISDRQLGVVAAHSRAYSIGITSRSP